MALETCQLVCPDCHAPISESTVAGRTQLVCQNDHGPWPVRDGIPWFTGNLAEFDGRWAETYRVCKSKGFFSAIAKRNGHWGIPQIIEPLLTRAGKYPLKMLDLGCGGGWEFLLRFGRVTGVDSSPTALQVASRTYDSNVGACVWHLPFPDNCFDVATSFWLVEHLGEVDFSELLREIRRVLKPGGHFIFLADLYSSKPILRWARSHPAEYWHYHVEKIGHYGLRSLNFTRHILHREGYQEKRTIPINKSSLLQPVTARWMFDNALGRKSRLLYLYTLFSRLTLKSAILHRIVYNLLIEYHRWADRRLPDSYAFSAVFNWQTRVAHGKKNGHSSNPLLSSEEPVEVDPWSGLPVSTRDRGRRPVAVIVDNVPAAYPQQGLAGATMVIQAPVEGLYTRLLAIYTQDFPSRIGPVRSARPYFLDWAGAFQPFFIHSGASPEARIKLENPDSLIGMELRYRLEDENAVPHAVMNSSVAYFDLSRNRPHFVFAVPGAIFENQQGLSFALPATLETTESVRLENLIHYRPEMKRNWHHTPSHSHWKAFACQIDVRTQPAAELGERFTWDNSAGGFRRAVLRGNRVVAASFDPDLLIRNLIVLETLVESLPGDLSGRLRIRACGEGPGYLWRDGPRMNITWRKFQPNMPIYLFNEHSGRILLRSGLTWIHFIGPGGEVRVK